VISSGSATRPLSRMGAQQSGPHPRSGREAKAEEVVPEMARRKGSDAGLSRWWVRSCRWCPQALQEFSFRFILHR